jgi:hypothetical protein
VAADTSYRFAELEPGTYTVRLLDTSVARSGLVHDGRSEVVVDLAAPGWGWQASSGGASPGFGIVRCRVVGRPDLAVRLWTAGWSGMTQRTGSKSEFGPDACEFAPLGAGRYKVQPTGISTVAEVTVDGSQIVWVTFVEGAAAPEPPARGSVLAGHVRTAQGAAVAGRTVKLSGPEGEQTTVTQADGAYRFEQLAAGVYRVAVDGAAVVREGLQLDGRNTLTVDLELPAAAESVIFGAVMGGAGRRVRLLLPPATTPVAEARGDADGRYRFDKLPAGAYTVQVLAVEPSDAVAAERGGVAVDGASQAQVDFTLAAPAPSASWEVKVEVGGVTPGYSVVRCQVEGDANREVRLWTAGWTGIVQRTGSKPEYGPDVCEFAPLGPGHYSVEAIGLEAEPASRPIVITRAGATRGLRAELDLPPNRLVWVRYRKVAPPVEPPRRSVIAGRVKGGAGRTARLEGAGLSRTTTIAADETYRFAELPAGVYTLAVLDADPPTGLTQTQANIAVDGTNSVQVDLDLGSLGPAKTMDHYLLVGGSARSKDDFVTALRYVGRFRPVVGTDEAEARKAHHVTILGSLSAVSALAEQGLRMADCQVQRIEGDYAQALGRLLTEDRPY